MKMEERSTRLGEHDFARRPNDLATLKECAEIVSRSQKRFDDRRVTPLVEATQQSLEALEARIAELETPWYRRLVRYLRSA